MLGTVNASGVKLVHHFGLGNLSKAKRTEKARCKGQNNNLTRAKRTDDGKKPLDHLLANPLATEGIEDGHRNDFHGSRLRFADFRMNLIGSASNDTLISLGYDKSINVLDDIAKGARHKLIAISANQRKDAFGIQ